MNNSTSHSRIIRRAFLRAVCTAALLVGVGAVPVAGAEEIDLGGRKINIEPPDGYCELDPSRPGEAQLLEMSARGQAGLNEQVAFWVSCATLAQARSVPSQSLTPYMLVLAPLSDGRILPTGRRREQLIDEMEGAMKSWAPNNTLSDSAETDIRRRFDETFGELAKAAGREIGLGEMRFLGQMGRDETAAYVGIMQRLVINGEEKTLSGIMSMTQVKGIAMSVNVYDDYVDAGTYDALQAAAQTTVRHLLGLNDDLVESAPALMLFGIDWGRATSSGLIGGLVGGVVGVIYLLIRKVLRRRNKG